MRIGMTGQNGFIGKKLFNRLLLDRYDIVPHYGRIEDCKFEQFQDCDLIIHLAGKNKGTDQEIIQTNLVGTQCLIQWCLLSKKPIILAGSDYKTESAYKQSRDAIKLICKSYGYLGLNSCVLNIPKVIGTDCKPFYNSFVTTLIYAAATNQLQIYEKQIKNLDEVLELVEVNDVCDAIVDLIQHPALGYTEYIFTKYDRVFKITFRELLDVLRGMHERSFITGLLEWYKEKYAQNK